ncbi:hypothetical protein D3C73_500060 [compost metagenome]
MVPTTIAAPYLWINGVTSSNFSSPSSRLMELMIALPWQYCSARSITLGSVVSIISGTFTFLTTSSKNFLISSLSSRSGSCTQTSITCAPLFTWARAISEASSYLPSTISRLNFREPSTFVRSPTMYGRLSLSIYTGSIPESAGGCCPSSPRGGYSANTSAIARI